jgi:hypothetical protein
MQFIYPEASKKDIQATGAAPDLNSDNPAFQNNTIFAHFYPDPDDQNQRGAMRIRIHNSVFVG